VIGKTVGDVDLLCLFCCDLINEESLSGACKAKKLKIIQGNVCTVKEHMHICVVPFNLALNDLDPVWTTPLCITTRPVSTCSVSPLLLLAGLDDSTSSRTCMG
jgi:hypothetical protein